MMTSHELVEAIRELSSLERIVGEHVALRRSGHQLFGLCPFHSERTPSLAIHPAKNVFRCHGCGVGGDVFRFVQLLHNCTFPQAVARLAMWAGIKLEGFRPSQELTQRVSALRAERQERVEFEKFCSDGLDAIDRKYRALGRAATHAEECLRTGMLNAYEQELAWAALERYRVFESCIEREGLTDLGILQAEWQARRGGQHVAA